MEVLSLLQTHTQIGQVSTFAIIEISNKRATLTYLASTQSSNKVIIDFCLSPGSKQQTTLETAHKTKQKETGSYCQELIIE